MATLVRLAVFTLCAAFLLVTCGGPLVDRLFPPQPVQVTISSSQGTVLAPPHAVGNSQRARPTSAAASQPVAPPVSAAATPTAAPLVGEMQPAAMQAAQAASPLEGQIDAYLRGLTDQGYFSGAVLVAHDGQVLFSRGYSLANYEQNLPATPQTRFRLASVTKQFTAMGIMILVAKGKLNVNDSVCVFLAECPEAWRPVTVHHLLSHTSGLPNYTDFANFVEIETAQVAPNDLINRFRYMPLGFAPGSLFQYTNSNYLLLAAIIERVSGQSYPNFLQEQIFTPLGMANTGVDPGDGSPLGGTRGYAGVNVPALNLNVSTLYGAGDLYSTVEDLYRWDQALYGEQLIPAQLRDQMFTPVYYGFGYGWKIGDWNGHWRVAHQGNMSGASTFISRYPNDRVVIIVLSNNEWADTVGIADVIAGMVMP
jgi:CubicO group peptidase (beta-lactamase class C family)